MADTASLSPRLAAALALAAKLHATDARKGTQIPTLAHLLGVCQLVQRHGGDEDEAVAALLHDAVEDHGDEISADEIEAQFGERVRRIVELSSDTGPGYRGGPKRPWIERKESYLAHARTANPADLRVTVADKVDNLRSIVADIERTGDEVWSRFNAPRDRQVWYYAGARDAYRTAGFSGPLLDEMERLLAVIEGVAHPTAPVRPSP